MELKYRAYDLHDESYMYEIEKVGAYNQKVYYSPADEYISTTKESFYDFVNDSNYEVEHYTGLKDCRGEYIYEGDIVLPIRINTIPKEYSRVNFELQSITYVGDSFIVAKGNYVEGKWIARRIENTGYGVTDYYESPELIVIGNIHYDEDLLRDRQKAEKEASKLLD